LISLEQSIDLINFLEPGDILLERKNWYLSNSGIPGFWPHSALYIGSLNETDIYFKDEKLLNGHSFSKYLELNFPRVYLDYKTLSNEGYNQRVLEAISKGVIFQPIEISTNADYVAALRPKLSKEDKLKAILTAFSHYKKPYDYDFDFASDSSLVCSELIYKSYLADKNKKGLTFNTSINLGREVLAPVDIVKNFDLDYNTTKEQLEFVTFYDGIEEEGIAVKKGIEAFRSTWTRPKWSFFQE